LILIEESDITPIPHEIEAIINPPKPVALLLGEGWDIPEEAEEAEEADEEEDAVLEWVPFGSQITYEYGRNYNYETWDSDKGGFGNESGELLSVYMAEMWKHEASKYSHLEDQGMGWDFLGFIYRTFNDINLFVEEFDTGEGKKTRKFFANSRNFNDFSYQIGPNMNAQGDNDSAYFNEGPQDETDTTADTRLTVSVQREKPGLVTIDLAFWEVA